MPILLDVPYSEKDQAKALGAHWHPNLKKWYVRDRINYARFANWLDSQLIVTDHIYIVEGTRRCYRCRKNTTVIGFGIDSWFDIYGDRRVPYEDMMICPIEKKIPDKLFKQLEQRYGFRRDYSKAAQETVYANHCCHCGAIQGNFYIFEEDSPFFIYDEEDAKKLVLRKIELPCDISVSTIFSYGSENRLIKEYATFTNSDFEWMKISEEDLAILNNHNASRRQNVDSSVLNESNELVNQWGTKANESNSLNPAAKSHSKARSKDIWVIIGYFIAVSSVLILFYMAIKGMEFLLMA